MILKYKKIPVIEVSLDELCEGINQLGDSTPFEYKLGAYYVMDTDTMGEIANIKRLMKNGFFSPKEYEVITMILADRKLNMAKRKAKERVIKKLRKLLLR